ncbi:hypothetical protein EVAR_38099_1 [Eumeta japonica]|uniref:Craniofacial development protein 2 n=1 Tax=Eumeta variegata TaxID=151549 RepID=A0A4C1W8I1_EUMVA|nr:hypothetical protein EVAR_38099_1 [Eumeta japonica]
MVLFTTVYILTIYIPLNSVATRRHGKRRHANNPVYPAPIDGSHQKRIEELEEALTSIKWDISVFIEVWNGISGEEVLERQNRSFHGISDRIAVLNIQIIDSKQPWSIIQVHAPIEQDTKLAKEKFYNDLTELMQKNNKYVMVMGDFNAKVGRKSNKDELVLGDYSTGDRNDNDRQLIGKNCKNL